jgi:hypothetical protein
MSPLRLGLVVAVCTALLWTLGALPPASAGYLTSFDLRSYFFPLYQAFYGALRAGAPMIWNPYQLCGMPVLGTLQGGFFYPLHLLYVLLPTPLALAASTALHLALLAGGGAAFARRAGLSAPAAILASAVLAMNGTLRQWQLWPYFLEAFAWMPVGAIGVLDLTEGRRARGTLVLALATGASCLAGSPQATVFAGYTWAGLLLARLASRAVAPRERLPLACTALAAIAIGGLLGAVAFLPAWEMAQVSMRPTRTLPPAYLYPLAFLPSIGGLVDSWLTNASYLLVPAMALIPFALLAGIGWLTGWAIVFGGLAGLVALGPTTPAFRLYLLLPALGWFREPYRLLAIVSLAAGILAGLGLDALTRRRRVLALTIVAVLLAAATVQGLRTPAAPPAPPYRSRDVPWTPALRDAYAGLAQAIGGDRVWTFGNRIGSNALPPKLPSLTRLRSIEDYEPLLLRRQAEFFLYFLDGSLVFYPPTTSFEGRMATMIASMGHEPPATRRRLLDLAATRFVLMPTPLRDRPHVAAFVRDAGLEPRAAPGPGLDLFENPHALPRAFVTYRARPAPPARDVLAAMARASFDPLVESFVEDDAGLGAAPDAPPRGGAAAIVRDDPHVVEVQAELTVPGLVVLADTFAPGWTARVDGVPARILATNHLFRGVPAPAGVHRVRFEYRPRSLTLGAALSALALLALATIARRATLR